MSTCKSAAVASHICGSPRSAAINAPASKISLTRLFGSFVISPRTTMALARSRRRVFSHLPFRDLAEFR
ncbi:MAG TPA: hypothetical protein VGL26_11460, partial [Jatrophihabitans sp.]